MHWEYLLLNLVILSGPLLLSFDRRIRFVQFRKEAFSAILIVLIPFVIMDALATGHFWDFNPHYTLNLRLLGLPPGEWLFFITVPYACLFTWQVLAGYFKNRSLASSSIIPGLMMVLFLPVAMVFALYGRDYTAIVATMVAITATLDFLLDTRVLSSTRGTLLLGLLILMMLIFNGYLTGRPVVIYDPAYQLDLRILSIPLEDFFYGFSLIYLNIIIFEKLKEVNRD